MSSLRVKAAGVILAILVVSMDFTPHIILARLLAQQQSYEDFLKMLENYLKNAVPPESDPIKECEYIAPEGLNPSYAERFWRNLAPFISLGCSEHDIRENLTCIYLNDTIPVELDDGTALLNLTGLSVEKSYDGSVKVKIPVVSDRPLNYTYFNSTNVRILYETWNETLVRYYRVERDTGLYRYALRDLETGLVFNMVSKLTVGTFYGGTVMILEPKPLWPWFLGNPVIAVPGRYEEVSIVVPRQEVKYKVLFPAYDPVYTLSAETPWVVHTDISPTVLEAGQTLRIRYWAEYMPYEPLVAAGLDEDDNTELLNATLTLETSDALQPLNGTVRTLNNNNTSGFFELLAVEQGLHNITLRLDGNARFSISNGQELVYTVEIVSPEVNPPSLSLSVTVDPSLIKHAKLIVKLCNDGESTARNVIIRAWGERAYPTSMGVGDIKAGETKIVEFTVALLSNTSPLCIEVSYCDHEGNEYVTTTLTEVWTNYFIVPEHYEEYNVTVPEHEEKRLVFIPDSEHYTHVRLYRITFEYPSESWYRAEMPVFNGYYGGFELTTRMKPEGEYSASELNAAWPGIDFTLLEVEPYWERIGVFDEENAAKLLGVDPSMLRANRVPEGYKTSLVGETWVSSRRIIMNAMEFAIYNQTINNYIMENNLQDEFRLCWEKYTNATRLTEPSDEEGFLTLAYRPLSVKGDGPLKSIQVRNYHGCNLSYRLRVYRYEVSYGAPLGQPPKPSLWESFTSPFNVASLGDSVLLASSLASEGYGYHVQLLHGSSVVAEAFFNLYSEPSPFWTCFWQEVGGRLPWILLTSGIIILVGFLTGHSTTAAYAGIAISVVSTVLYLVGGTLLNFEEIEQCMSAYSLFNDLAQRFTYWSYELSNYTPVEIPQGPQTPVSVYKPYEPKGPLAALYWNYSQYFSGVATRILEDTALDLVIGCGITDFEIAMSKNASECERGRATGRIVSAALSFAMFVIATKIASIEAKAANTKAPWKFVSAVKAWATPAIFDLLETLVKSRRAIIFVVKNPGLILSIGKFLVVRGLRTLKGKALELWNRVKAELGEIMEKIEAGVERLENLGSSIIEKLKNIIDFHDEEFRFAKDIGQEEAIETDHAFDGAGFDIPERAEAFKILNAIAAKSREAGETVSKWLRMLEEVKLRGIVGSGLLSEVGELEVNGLKSLQVALEDPNRLAELVEQPKLVSMAMATLSSVKYYAFESRNVGEEGHVWLDTRIDAGTYRVRAELESGGGATTVMWTLCTDGTNEIMVPKKYREGLAGKKVKLEICGYVPELHFPKHFSLPSLEGGVFLDFIDGALKIGSFDVEWVGIGETVKDPELGFGLTIETNVKSIMGLPLKLRFYEEKAVRCLELSGTLPRENIIPIEGASLEVKQLGDEQVASLKLTLKWSGESWESIYPIKTLKLEIGKNYPMDFFVGDKDRTTGLLTEIRKIFGYDAVAGIQKKMEAGEIRAKIVFNDGATASTSGKELVVRTGGTQRVVEIVFYEPMLKPLFTIEEAKEYFRKLGIQKEDLIDYLADRYYEVLGYSAEDIEGTGDENLKSIFGELRTIERYPQKVKDVQLRVIIDGNPRYIDIVWIDGIVESKYWTSKRTYELHFEDPERFNELVNQIRVCNKAREQESLEKVYLIFGKKGVISDEKFNSYMQKLRDALGGDTSWLVIWHGLE